MNEDMNVCFYDCMCRLIMCPRKPKCTEVNSVNLMTIK